MESPLSDRFVPSFPPTRNYDIRAAPWPPRRARASPSRRRAGFVPPLAGACARLLCRAPSPLPLRRPRPTRHSHHPESTTCHALAHRPACHALTPRPRPPLSNDRPRRAAPRRAAVAAAPATSPLSSLPADAPSDPLAALAGVAVTRASDGTRVSDFAALVARRAAATPSRRTAVVFMRSFG